MNRLIILFIWLLYLPVSCGDRVNQDTIYTQHTPSTPYTSYTTSTQTEPGNPANEKAPNGLNPAGQTIETRFIVPDGFERTTVPVDSFAGYLRKLPLKPHGEEVKLYNGSIKPNTDIYEAVVNMDIDPENLQQCADAIMRLRGEYLWEQKRYHEIHFNFTNGFRVDYSKWMEGCRMVVNGNKTSWKKSAPPSNSYEDFRKYMKLIFLYAGTYSLSKELITVDYKDLKIGDILIQGGSPGHAVIVVDSAVNSRSGEKIYLLAQSYMPAQEIQVLKNPMNRDLSPWYLVEEKNEIIDTPEWSFKNTDLKRFTGQ